MPDLTPLFNIPYPCHDEVVTATIIAANAQATEGAIESVFGTVDSVLAPPSVGLRNDAAQLFPVGVVTVINYADAVFNSSGMWVVGSPSIVSIVEPGTYFASVLLDGASGASVASYRTSLRLNGVTIPQKRQTNSGSAGTTPSNNFSNETVLPGLVAGDQITSDFAYAGAAGNAQISAFLNVVRLATW